jgi:membrane protein YdbS with pleckstrin-like domain
MLGYFNLSKRAIKGRLKKLEESGKEESMSPMSQVFLYIGVLIGVIFSNAVTQFSGGTEPKIAIDVVTVVISAIVSLMIVPYVYQKLTLDPKSPFLVQFGFFVQHGIFWQVIMGAIGKAI